MTIDDIIYFWFVEAGPEAWWKKQDSFDQLVRERFSDIYARAKNNELATWRVSPEGRLAEIIILDQFSRNMYRGTPQSFQTDDKALWLSRQAVSCGTGLEWREQKAQFLLMPYMHSEDKAMHIDAVRVFKQYGLKESLVFELRHKAIIDRFGRYPHRNEVLGRVSTPEEQLFLLEPGSGF